MTAAFRRFAAIAAIALPALILAVVPASGQGAGGAAGQPAASAGAPGASPTGVSPADASTAPAADSSAKPQTPDTIAARAPSTQDSLSRPKSRADTVLVVQHHFNHKQQIITGSVVMGCLALMLVIMNNYNPR